MTHPFFLINGKPPTDPDVLTAKPGQRIRLRVINAASDTIFTVTLGGHRLTITHSDGHAVEPTEVGAFYIGMGERYDAIVTLGDGVFPLVARPFGKTSGGQAIAVVRTGSGSAPPVDAAPAELSGQVLIGSQLRPAESAKLPDRARMPPWTWRCKARMKPYQWGMNGAKFGENEPLTVKGWPAAADQRHEPDDDDPPAAPTRAHLRPATPGCAGTPSPRRRCGPSRSTWTPTTPATG